MKKINPNRYRFPLICASLFMSFLMVMVSGCQKPEPPPPVLAGDYKVVNLVADVAGYGAARLDNVLVNPWGLAFSAGGTPWINTPPTHRSLVYNSEGAQARVPVVVPDPFATNAGFPSGIVFNATNDFILSNGTKANFIFSGLDGVISGWNNAFGNIAARTFNDYAGNVYTGLAISNDAGNNFIYASNFSKGRIDVFDKAFAPAVKAFKDPNLPAGYAPFNIQHIGDLLYVTYAKVGPDGRDLPGPGNGFVSVFTPGGTYVKRFASKGPLNAPWGVALAPASFFPADVKMGGTSKPAILVGNFGDGMINAFDLDGKFLGAVRSEGKPIVIDGLWAISFAPATAITIDPNRLYFTAGPDHERHGLFGYVIKK